MAALGLNEGSGLSVVDSSGRGNGGSLAGGALWSTSGRFGSAVSFDGVDDVVSVPDANSLDLTSGMTLEAWVNASVLGGWRTALMKEKPSGLAYGLYASSDTGRPSGWVSVGAIDRGVNASSALAAGTWAHVATTYDGSTQRIFVNGTQVGTRAQTGAITTSTSPLRIGGNSAWGEYFAGRIDEVRVYNRALTAAEIQTDMTTPIGPQADPALSVTPASLSFTATAGGTDPAAKTLSVTNTGGGSLNFTASGGAAWLAVSPASGSAPGTVTVSPHINGLAAGTYNGTVTVTAAGSQGSPKDIPVTLTVSAPTPPALSVTPATLSFSATVNGANPAAQALSVTNAGSGSLSWTASDDAPWLTESPASGSAPGSISEAVSITGLTAGSYSATVTVTAAGATGSPKQIPVTLTVNPASTALVAALGLNEGSGLSVVDSSGRGNGGSLAGGALWSTSGRFGSAVSFDGVDDVVSVPDANSLDLTSGMTLEAWVNASVLGGWRTALMKEKPSGLAYGLYASSDTGRPSGWVSVGAIDRGVNASSALAAGTWAHVATTYDGSTQRIFVNGTQVGTRAQTGAITTSASPLRIGGNSAWGEYFAGRIDEVRVYNRALTAAEIQTDMTTPIGPPG